MARMCSSIVVCRTSSQRDFRGELIETSGHTQGHQSVLVRLPETGAVLLTIDAVAMQQNFHPDRELTPFDGMDLETVQASTRKLIDIAEREKALVIFGHDTEQWQ